MTIAKLRLYFLGNGIQASQPIVWVIGFFAFLNVYSIQAVLPMVMEDFHANAVQAGITVGATVLAVGLVSPVMGMLSDALGRRGIICLSMFAMTLPTALIPIAPSLSILIALRFLQGLAVPGIVVVLIAYIAEEFRQGGGVARMTATYVGGTVMGGFSGRFITGHLGEVFGWRGAFVTLAAMNFAGAVLVLWLLPTSRHFVANKNVRNALSTLGQHLKNARLMASCAVGFCVLFSLVGTFTYINLHLASSPFNLSASGLANVFGVYLVGVLVTPIAGRHMERLGFTKTLLWSLSISASGLMLTLVPWLPIIVVGLTVCSCGVFLCQSATISAISANVSHGRSLATGIYYMSYYAGGAVGTVVAGVAYEHGGWVSAVAVIFLIQALAATIVALVWRQRAGVND